MLTYGYNFTVETIPEIKTLISYDQFVKASILMMSRSFSYPYYKSETKKCMIPFADMANHTKEHNLSNQFQKGDNAGMKYLAIKDITEGE